jgi:hypothetical protein
MQADASTSTGWRGKDQVRWYEYRIAAALATLTQGRNILTSESPGSRNGEGSVFNLEAATAECDAEGKTVVKDYVSTGRTPTTRNPAARCTATVMSIRVTVVARESNCKVNTICVAPKLEKKSGSVFFLSP